MEMTEDMIQRELEKIPSKEQLQGIDMLDIKERAITAGLSVDLDVDEAERFGIDGFDVLDPNDEELEADLLESRFDPCEFDLDNYELIPDSLLKKA